MRNNCPFLIVTKIGLWLEPRLIINADAFVARFRRWQPRMDEALICSTPQPCPVLAANEQFTSSALRFRRFSTGIDMIAQRIQGLGNACLYWPQLLMSIGVVGPLKPSIKRSSPSSMTSYFIKGSVAGNVNGKPVCGSNIEPCAKQII